MTRFSNAIDITLQPGERLIRPTAAPPTRKENLSPDLYTALQMLRKDFESGISRIADDLFLDQRRHFIRQIRQGETGGRPWKDYERKLLDNGADLLGRAAIMPGGPYLIGAYKNGDLAITQRSQGIVNVRREEDGTLRLFSHEQALAAAESDGEESDGEKWGNYEDIRTAVYGLGFHLPGDNAVLVQAAEAKREVTYYSKDRDSFSHEVVGGPYCLADRGEDTAVQYAFLNGVKSPDPQRGSRPEVWAMWFDRAKGQTSEIYVENPERRDPNYGAVLWLRG